MRLRAMTEADLPYLFEVISHPDVYAGGWGGGPAAYSPDFGEWAAAFKRWMLWDKGRVYAIRAADTDQIIGVTSMNVRLGQLSAASIRWTALAPRVWGTGVNDEVTALLLGHAFDRGVERVSLKMDILNERARGAAERIGAVHEGIRRHTGRRADGTWRNEAVYTVLSGEWPRVRETLLERAVHRPEGSGF